MEVGKRASPWRQGRREEGLIKRSNTGLPLLERRASHSKETTRSLTGKHVVTLSLSLSNLRSFHTS